MNTALKPTPRTEWPVWLLLVLTLAAAWYFQQTFPDQVATHWNLQGQADAWSSKAFGVWLLPAIILGMYVLFTFLPFADPKKNRYAEFITTYRHMRLAIMGLMVILYGITGAYNLGYNIDVGRVTSALVGVLFILLGIWMRKIKYNWFVGIRTPWTLSSEAVWDKTHRFGGRFFIAAGIIMLLTPYAPVTWQAPLFILSIIGLIFGTLVLSYVFYLQEKKKSATASGSRHQS